MRLSYLVTAILSPLAALAVDSSALSDQLTKGGVIPDVLGRFTPTSELRITYQMVQMVQMGMQLSPEEVHSAPHVWFPKTNNSSQYALMMLDAGSEHGTPYLHWIATNIDGQRPATDVANQDPLHQYNPYLPPAAQEAPHKFIFGLYEQSGINQTFPGAPANRDHFDAQKFAKDHGLNPVAGLFFYV